MNNKYDDVSEETQQLAMRMKSNSYSLKQNPEGKQHGGLHKQEGTLVRLNQELVCVGASNGKVLLLNY
jgi:hypothetical protein